MVAANVEITSMELIKPSSPIPLHSKEHKLSFLDQFVNPDHVPLIFFYQSQYCLDLNDQSKRSRHLKQSLSEALTKFYHLAGRIKGNVSIDCNDSGVLFVEARVHVPLSQAIQNAPIDELNQYLPLEPFAFFKSAAYTGPKHDDLPLLAVKISFFECGGTAIGICMSHKVADLASILMFMNYWAALNRGEKIDELAQPSCDIAGQLFPGIDREFPNRNYTKNGVKEKLVSKRFVFDKEKLGTLKQLASSSEQVNDPTRVEAVSAFIWKQFIDISLAKSDNKSIFLAFHAVNLRARMKSSLPSSENSKGFNNVFGNLSITAKATSMSSSRGSDKHYQELVSILRTAIRSIDDDFIKIVQSGIPDLNTFNNSGRLLRDPQEVDFCLFSSWCRFPIYEVDYGWGKPVSVCTSAIPFKNTVILMSTTRCGDGIEAWITMLEDEMAMLPDELLSLESTIYY